MNLTIYCEINFKHSQNKYYEFHQVYVIFTSLVCGSIQVKPGLNTNQCDNCGKKVENINLCCIKCNMKIYKKCNKIKMFKYGLCDKCKTLILNDYLLILSKNLLFLQVNIQFLKKHTRIFPKFTQRTVKIKLPNYLLFIRADLA